jgi:hypothetical protein
MTPTVLTWLALVVLTAGSALYLATGDLGFPALTNAYGTCLLAASLALRSRA